MTAVDGIIILVLTFLVFFVVCFGFAKLFSYLGKYVSKPNSDGIFAALTMIIIVVIMVSVADIGTKMASSVTNDNVIADGFTIEGYEVDLIVSSDNEVEVTEKIDVNFYETGHHGIYKFTPSWLEYTGKDGKTIKRKSVISELRAINDDYTVDTVNKKERIKIGSPYVTVAGDHQYVIKYNYDMGKDPFKGFDEFIFHAFGDFWGTEIKNPKIVIHMPKDITGAEINAFTDKYRSLDVTNLINKEIDGNTVTITLNDLRISKSLTLDIALPDGYFTGGSWNYGWGSVLISIIVILLTIYVIYLWSTYGKDYEKKIPTVEFYPPEDLSSAEIGYIYNNRHVSKKLTISLILQLASKGYIKIDEIKDGKRKSKIQLTKVFVPPERPSSADIPYRIIKVQKLKDIDDNLSKVADAEMTYLFAKSDTKEITGNVDAFLKVKDELVSGGYIKIVSDNEKEVLNSPLKKRYDEAVAAYEKELEKHNFKVEQLPKKTGLENIVYGNLFSFGEVIILSDHTSFYKTFDQVEKELEDNFQNKIHDDKSRKVKRNVLIAILVSLVLSLVSFFYIEDMDPAWSILYYIPFACVIINAFFAVIMGRKTEYGEMISARVKGFRDFLITAEKEKLESLVEQNPHYFYDILPYTYVLNVSKKWVKKFEDIKMPDVDMGNYNYSSDSSFHSIFDNVTYPVSSSSGGSSSGCSSCGGGCSSCGGGCSSCGGGGSW